MKSKIDQFVIDKKYVRLKDTLYQYKQCIEQMKYLKETLQNDIQQLEEDMRK